MAGVSARRAAGAPLGQLLNIAARVMREETIAVLLPLGLEPRELGILASIARQPGVVQSALGREHLMDRTTISTMLQRFTREGWVRRAPAKTDARELAVTLTPSGRVLLRRARAASDAVERRVTARMATADVRTLGAALEAMLAALRDQGTCGT
jgi:DNA-binding MarR family transcriptional regulator